MQIEFEPKLGKLDADAWRTRVEEIADEHGNFTPLDNEHFAAFLDAGPKLIVTFENAHEVLRANAESTPRGFQFTRHEGWSCLSIISEGESWFRSEAVYRYFDRLTDDGFFDDFDQVLFYGAGAGGYAACAYCVASPGCNVLALRPQATLDARIAGWDPRYAKHRRLNFTDRYGFAPDMIDAAKKVYVVFDSAQRMDASHAAIFTKSNVTALPLAGLGARLDLAMDQIEMTTSFTLAAMEGSLDQALHTKAMKARRTNNSYLRFLFMRMLRSGHPVMAANICSHVLKRTDDAFFTKQIAELKEQGHKPSRPFKPFAA